MCSKYICYYVCCLKDYPTRNTRRSRRLNTLQVKQLMDGQEIYGALMNAEDPQAIQVDSMCTVGVVYTQGFRA